MEMRTSDRKCDITLVLGPNGSGKSLFAETLAVESAKKRIYLATMVSQNEENEKRIEKHRLQRQEKGFITIEKDWNIDQIKVDADSVVLLEDVSNLLANGIFIHHQGVEEAFSQILSLAERCRKLIAVNIGGLQAEGYEGETAAYINGINELNRRLTKDAQAVYQMADGKAVAQKQSIFENTK